MEGRNEKGERGRREGRREEREVRCVDTAWDFLHLLLQFQLFLSPLKVVGHFSLLILEETTFLYVELLFGLRKRRREEEEGGRERGKDAQFLLQLALNNNILVASFISLCLLHTLFQQFYSPPTMQPCLLTLLSNTHTPFTATATVVRDGTLKSGPRVTLRQRHSIVQPQNMQR